MSEEDHAKIADAVIAKIIESDSFQAVTKEEKVWLASGVEHLDHKHWPLLGDFVGVLRKAILLIVLAVVISLIGMGMMSAVQSGGSLYKGSPNNKRSEQ